MILALALTAAPALAQQQTAANAQAFLKLKLENRVGSFTILDDRLYYTGRDAQITSVVGSECSTTFYGYDGGKQLSRTIDWSKAQSIYPNDGYIKIEGAVYLTNGQRIDVTNIGGLGYEDSQRAMNAMTFLKKHCDPGSNLGF